jgi:hypothetical protein
MKMMPSQTFTSEIPREHGRLSLALRLVSPLGLVIAIVFGVHDASCQGGTAHQDTIRQVPAPLPKLALNGSSNETKAGVSFRKYAMAITNRERYPSEMFHVPPGGRFPTNPCPKVSSRIVMSVYSERGDLITGCIGVPEPARLGSFTFLIQKGTQVPEFVYAVVTDRLTGAAYRSNLVSPSTGATR